MVIGLSYSGKLNYRYSDKRYRYSMVLAIAYCIKNRMPAQSSHAAVEVEAATWIQKLFKI